MGHDELWMQLSIWTKTRWPLKESCSQAVRLVYGRRSRQIMSDCEYCTYRSIVPSSWPAAENRRLKGERAFRTRLWTNERRIV